MTTIWSPGQAISNDATAFKSEGEQHHGQVRMAYRFAAVYGSRFMYVKGIGWFVWDGKRWAEDEKDAAKTAVLDILRSALSESLGGDKELRADVLKCESSAGVAGVLNLASALPGVRVAIDALDADPFLLNCANGTLDLRTRRLHPHHPDDRITKLARGAYAPTSDRTTWDVFLGTVLPEEHDRAYLQRVVGQSAYGRVREHLFPVLSGSGCNGKGTAYGAIANSMGDYARVINPNLLMAAERGGGGPEMMTLRGARLVIGSETDEGRQLDAALMKRLTGGDQLTARRLYQEPVTWTPSHQLLYVTNHLPKVKGNDPALWRRIRVIRFDVVVPETQRDQTLPEQLELLADAILTWVVSGWFTYEDLGGMHEPNNVLQATDSYQTESDAVKRFIQSECSTAPQVSLTTRQLYEEWTRWAVQEGVDLLSERAFGKELDRLGFPARRTNSGASRAGIALKAQQLGNEER